MSAVGVVLSLLFAGGGVWLGWTGWQRRRERQTIAARETTDALSVTPGPTEVSGTAVADDDRTLTAPFTDASCLLAEWQVEEWDTSGDSSSWQTLDTGTLAVPFAVDDGTGTVRVAPEGASIELTDSWWTETVEIDDEPPATVKQFLDRDSTPRAATGSLLPSFGWGNEEGDRRYHQRLLRPGEEVYVHGTATRTDSRSFGDVAHEIRESADDGHRDAELFIIADGDESDVIASRRDAETRLLAGAITVALGATFFVASLF